MRETPDASPGDDGFRVYPHDIGMTVGELVVLRSVCPHTRIGEEFDPVAIAERYRNVKPLSLMQAIPDFSERLVERGAFSRASPTTYSLTPYGYRVYCGVVVKTDFNHHRRPNVAKTRKRP